MCLWSFITGKETPSAKVSDGRLILSLPDADTPVVWIMDMNDAATTIIRLEQDKQGLNILKKYGCKENASETIAAYTNRKSATRALVRTAKALERARRSHLHTGNDGKSVIVRPASMSGRIFHFFLYLWVAAYLLGALYFFIMNNFYNMTHNVHGQATGQTEQSSTLQPSQETEQSASGVPLSADDFLKQNKTGALPR